MTTYRKLAPSLKANWLQALRSGKFKQCQGQLKAHTTFDENGDPKGKPGHCCLGVLCEIQGRMGTSDDSESVLMDFDPDNFDKSKLPSYKDKKFDPSSTWVPPAWVDIKAQQLLATMNDGGEHKGEYIKKKGFKAIANWIEKNL